MKKPLLVLAAATLGSLVSVAFASPPAGGGRHVGAPGAHSGGGYRPGYPAYRPVYRPGYRPGYPVYRPGYGGGYGAYRGPRVGVYYGAPAYWGAWPYAAAAWGVGYGAYAFGYPYASTPLVVNTVNTPQVYIEQDHTPLPAPASSYWYYCTQPAGYFPYVKDCAAPWLKVVPQAPGEQATPPQLAR